VLHHAQFQRFVSHALVAIKVSAAIANNINLTFPSLELLGNNKFPSHSAQLEIISFG
jgi:hypothetical protein